MERFYLKYARLKKGYSQEKVANTDGISKQHYSLIEKGKIGNGISFSLLADICILLEIDFNTAYIYEKVR
jgi:transcriptional regulator with XRE-family HTH domain